MGGNYSNRQSDLNKFIPFTNIVHSSTCNDPNTKLVASAYSVYLINDWIHTFVWALDDLTSTDYHRLQGVSNADIFNQCQIYQQMGFGMKNWDDAYCVTMNGIRTDVIILYTKTFAVAFGQYGISWMTPTKPEWHQAVSWQN